MIRIVLVEDHQVVREALRVMLEREKDFSVVGEAADGLQALGMLDKAKPDVVIVDLILPGLSGMEVIREIHRRWTKVGIVVLSMHSDEAYVLRSLKNGAHAYVLKDVGSADLIKAIRKAHAGKRYLSAPFTEKGIKEYGEKVMEGKLDIYDTLTRRERQILQLSAEGNTCREIAGRLDISRRTAETHRANILRTSEASVSCASRVDGTPSRRSCDESDSR